MHCKLTKYVKYIYNITANLIKKTTEILKYKNNKI